MSIMSCKCSSISKSRLLAKLSNTAVLHINYTYVLLHTDTVNSQTPQACRVTNASLKHQFH